MNSEVTTFNPFDKQIEFLDAVFSGDYTFIMYGGSIRGGKSYAGLGAVLMLCKIYPGSRWAIVRKDLPTIKRNLLPTWDKIKPAHYVRSFNYSSMTATMTNDSQIIFFPENYVQDKELNRWRGLEVNGFLLEEINEMEEVSFYKAIERSGSYVVPNGEQPPPLIMATCNPSYGWVKEKVYTPWKNNELPEKWLYIPAKIFDNPYISEEYKESLKQLPAYEYKVFVDGDWEVQLKTGGEFWKSFELNKHVKPLRFDPATAIHISVDNNVRPYIAITIWQKVGNEIRQIHELPCKDPENTVTKAAEKFIRYAKSINYSDVVFIYGDQTTTAGNTIDDDKKTFFDKFRERIEKEYSVQVRMPSKNPPVALSGAFINDIYENNLHDLTITINESCKESINDYIMTKEDKDGKMLKKRITDPKTKISYEEHGHMSDTKRYMIIEMFKTEFRNYKKGSDNIPRPMGGARIKRKY